MTHYLLYWKVTDEERRNITKFKRRYAGGGQLDKVVEGDVLWIINLTNNHLYLIGRIDAGQKVYSEAAAKQLLQTDESLWKADIYVIAKANTVENMKWLNIDQIATKLRFVSSSERDSLSLLNGKYQPMQLRSMRCLTTKSAKLLQQEWYGNRAKDNTLDYLELTEDDRVYSEGQLVARTTKQRIRNRKLVADAKQAFKDKNDGQLFCKLCGFSFKTAYGIDDYIEAHHLEPIGDLEAETTNKIGKLKMLCANCHRALHHPLFANDIEKLRKYIEERKS